MFRGLLFIHVQRCIQLSQPSAFGFQFFLLRKGLVHFLFRGFHLLMDIFKLLLRSLNPLWNAIQHVFDARQVAKNFVAQFYRMGHRTAQDELKIVGEQVELYLHTKAAIMADFRLSCFTSLFAGIQQRFTGFLLLRIHSPHDLHAHKILFGQRMISHRLHVFFKTCDVSFGCFNLLGKEFQELIFQPVAFALVVGFHQPKTGNVDIQIHLFLDSFVSGTQRLDFSVGQHCFIHVIAGTYRTFAGHDLRNKLLLILNRLPQVAIKGSFRDIAINEHFWIGIALTYNAARALFQITRSPRTIKVVQCNQPVLTICTRAHFGCAAYQHTHMT